MNPFIGVAEKNSFFFLFITLSPPLNPIGISYVWYQMLFIKYFSDCYCSLSSGPLEMIHDRKKRTIEIDFSNLDFLSKMRREISYVYPYIL
jgi:hypothetical protein